jgi:hypothetical protein
LRNQGVLPVILLPRIAGKGKNHLSTGTQQIDFGPPIYYECASFEHKFAYPRQGKPIK